MTRLEKIYPTILKVFIAAMSLLLVWSTIQNDWSGLFVIIQALVIVCIPSIIDKKFSIHTPYILRLGFLLFMFSTLILGEIADLYNTLWWWDILLHTVSSAGITIIGFILLTIIYKDRDLQTSPWLTSFLAFSFAICLAVLWEVYEFFIDIFFETDSLMQQGNTDTMTDLLVAILGSLFVCWSGFIYIKYRRGHSLVASAIEEGKVNNL